MKRLLAFVLLCCLLLTAGCGKKAEETPAQTTAPNSAEQTQPVTEPSVEATVGTSTEGTTAPTTGAPVEGTTAPTTGTPAESNPAASDPTQGTTEAPALVEWQKAYLEFLNNQKANHVSYTLIYVDNDEIPELYLKGNDQAKEDIVCAYKNGKVVEQRLEKIGNNVYIKKTGMLINLMGKETAYYTNVYTLGAEGFAKTFSAYENEKVTEADGKISTTYEYYVGDKAVGMDEYNKAVDGAFNFFQSSRLDEKAVSYEEIVKQISAHK